MKDFRNTAGPLTRRLVESGDVPGSNVPLLGDAAPGDSDEALLVELQTHAERFDAVLAELWRNRPHQRMHHPFFGGLTLDQAIRLSSVHTRHHAAFLIRPKSTQKEVVA